MGTSPSEVQKKKTRTSPSPSLSLISSMDTLSSQSFTSTLNLNLYRYPFKPSLRPSKPNRVSLNTPPPDFDYKKSTLLPDSRAAVAQAHPELLDLADNGTLVLVQKSRFGPVPDWRADFVEPEAIWLIGTTHVSRESALDVERVVRAVNPDSVVVELCRSRQVWFRYLAFGQFC